VCFSYYEKIGGEVTCIDEEIPFELPDKWTWCRGFSCFKEMSSKKPTGTFCEYIDIDSIDNKNHCVISPKTIAVKDAPSRARRAVEASSVLFSLVRPYLENIAFIDRAMKDCIASTGFYICTSNGALYPRFMFFLMTSHYVVSGLNGYMKGDNSPSVSKENITNWLYPIPPYNEQIKISNQIAVFQKSLQSIESSLN